MKKRKGKGGGEWKSYQVVCGINAEVFSQTTEHEGSVVPELEVSLRVSWGGYGAVGTPRTRKLQVNDIKILRLHFVVSKRSSGNLHQQKD